jgi:hypothetical protein
VLRFASSLAGVIGSTPAAGEAAVIPCAFDTGGIAPMGNDQQAKQAMSRGDITPLSLTTRVIGGGVLAAVVLTAFEFLLSSGRTAAVVSAPNLVVLLLSGILYVAVMTPLARRVGYRPFPRFLAVFVPLYVTGTLTDLIEAAFYTTLLPPTKLIAALIIEALPMLLITGIVVSVMPASPETRLAPRFGQVMRERSWSSWLWRIVLAGAPYALIYLLFATLVAPIEHAYYSDPAFLASLHTRVPSTQVTVLLEAGRGILFVLAVLPVIAVMRKSRWSTGLYIAVLGAALEAWIPLLGQASWPVMMRVGNVLELTADACGRALLMALLVALPPVGKHAVGKQQTLSSAHSGSEGVQEGFPP